MKKPSPYPDTDYLEEAAVNIFKSLINLKRVKADIRTRDKYPNIDGTIELVDQDCCPFGKLDVQVKKMDDGSKKYSCPVKLISYSVVSTLPVILVCVDISLHKAYWRQITPTMPEYKNQKSEFTVYFNEASDSISSDEIYIQKWGEIIHEYQKRITDFPKLQKEIANRLTVNGLSPANKRLFQIYIDTINKLLDDDFLVVKKELFPDVWKLGVGVFSADEKWLSYQIYKIHYEEPAPLICKLEGNPFIKGVRTSYTVSTRGTSRKNFDDPEIAANKFVLEWVKRAVEERLLPVHGLLTSTDILFSFVDLFHDLLSVSPNQDIFSTDELNYALNYQMMGICASMASTMSRSGNHYVQLNLENIDIKIHEKKIKPILPSEFSGSFSINSNHFPITAVFDALRYILSTGAKTIQRPFIRRDLSLLKNGDWIWSGYDHNSEIKNITLMLNNAIPEYSEFIRQNRLKLHNSKYLDKSTTVLMEYEPTFRSDSLGPILREHYLNNSSQSLPKSIVSICSDDNPPSDMFEFPHIKFNGNRYESFASSENSADILFSNTPMLNLLYRMLINDLSDQYGIKNFQLKY